MTVLLNTFSQLPTNFVGLQIDYFTSVTNVKVDGSAYTSKTIISADTATDFSHTVQFDYGGNTYNFVTSKDANSNELKAFTVQAGALANAAPVITGGATASLNVAENQTAVTDVATTDDGDSEGSGLTYSFTTVASGGADNALFSMNANGVITFNVAPDFEIQRDADSNNVYNIQVTVTDSGSLSDLQNILVTVIDVDENVPTLSPVTIASDNADPTKAAPGDTITVTFIASEKLIGAPTVTIAGEAATVTGVMPNFTATLFVTANTAKGSVAINISAFADTAGNNGATVTATTDGSSVTNGTAGATVEETRQVVSDFMTNRAAAQSNVQPKIGGFVTGAGGSFAVNGNDTNLVGQYAASVILDPASQSIADSFDVVENASRKGKVELWTQIYGANTDAGNSNNKFWVGYFGGHTFLSEDMLIGALLQIDYADEENKVAGSDGHGTGWMVGPYIAGKVTGQDVFYEARVAIGGSDNKISPTGAYTDSFETERWMIAGKLNGAYEWGEITFSPNIGISYFSEKQKSYTDSLANVIPSQTITSGEITFGPEISKAIALDNGATLIPKAGLNAIYTYKNASTNAAQTLTFKDGDLRAKLDFGLAMRAANGMSINSELFYDGFGIDDYESWGGLIKWTVPLH